MRGFPKTLNSKTDYIYIKENFSAEQWKPAWQALLDSRLDWFNMGEVEQEKGITDKTHKVVESEPVGESGATVFYQFELRENPTCKLLKIGFTVEEVEEALKGA